MKKLLFIIVVIIASNFLNTLNAQVKAGFKMGADFSNLKLTVDGYSVNDSANTKRLISPRLGFFLEVAINDYLFIQAGLYGSARGFRFDAKRYINEKLVDSKEYQIILYVDLPVNFGYKYDMGGAKLFVMAGPMLSYGTYATLLYKADNEWSNDHQTVGKDKQDFVKPINFGANLEAGVEVSRFQFTIFYTYGFSNLSNAEDMKINTNIIGLTAAIKFGKVDNGRGYR